MDERPTVGSLFSGIGGMDLGLERAGFRVSWQVEWDAWCQRVLAKHWPDVPRYGDITAVDWSGVERVDLLAGGFPCQPFSLAGQLRGKSDDRWLWPAFAAAIGALRPSLVLVENVPGLLAGHGGMGSVLGDLAALGYDAEWDCIPAAAVGAPHLRYRVWVVAYTRGEHGRAGRERRSPFFGPGLFEYAYVGSSNPLADAICERGRSRIGGREDAADARQPSGRPTVRQWDVEPDVGRVAHGVPSRVDRLRGLGNAVVPQVVEVIGRQLYEALR